MLGAFGHPVNAAAGAANAAALAAAAAVSNAAVGGNTAQENHAGEPQQRAGGAGSSNHHLPIGSDAWLCEASTNSALMYESLRRAGALEIVNAVAARSVSVSGSGRL
jgi:hypothetical protein